MEKLYGLLGWPVSHSVSPAMMNAAFAACDVGARYLPFAVSPAHVGDALRGLCGLGAGGVNVTIPHKQAVCQLVDTLTAEARLAGAVNTVRFEPDGSMTGHNTDISGWWQSVSTALVRPPATACILGAGGAARAVLAALSLYASSCKVSVCARNEPQLAALAENENPDLALTVVPWVHRHEAVASAQLVVNATSLGMWPHEQTCPLDDLGCLAAGQVVQDMVYRPRQTHLLSAAAAHGANTVEGLRMLVLQGAAAFTFWTLRDAPIAVMEQAAVAALQTP